MSKNDYKNVPPQLLDGAAESLAYGNTKYGVGQKRGKSSANDRYNSLMGHLQGYQNGQLCDSESGLCHLKHAAMQLAFLMELEEAIDEEMDDGKKTWYLTWCSNSDRLELWEYPPYQEEGYTEWNWNEEHTHSAWHIRGPLLEAAGSLKGKPGPHEVIKVRL